MHSSHPTSGAAKVKSDTPWYAQDPRRRRNLITASVVLLSLALLGGWVYYEVRRSVITLLNDKLTTILEADVTALGLWIKNEKESVVGWASEPTLRAAIANLTKLEPAALDSEEGRRYRHTADRALSGLVTAETAAGYLIIDRTGRIIGSDEESIVGRMMTSRGMELTSRILAGEAVVTAPFRVRDYFYPDIPQADLAVTAKASPIYDDEHAVIAALIVGINPEEFSRILSIARFGKTGDTYAFGPNGWMLSDSRHIEELRQLGLVPQAPGARTIFAFQIRDPGGDLSRGYAPKQPLAERPFTRMAASALAGESGIDLEGYRDYRGVKVMGAWKWLDAYGFGVATEVDRKHALAVLRPIIVAFIGLFSIVVAAAAALLVNMLVVQRLRRRIEMTRLGQYTLLEKIGEGGVGRVYLARHALLRRPTAVKFLRPDAMSEESIERFEQEVQKTSQLQHPNTVAIYDYGRTPEGIFYYAMEYLQGYSLAKLIEIDRRLPAGRAIYLLRQVCFSLREAHDAGLCHLDIKPLNVLVSARGGEYDVVKVVDFGLVRDVSLPETPGSATNVIPGTPPYIAPERLKRGAVVDARADIYSLGTLAFNLLTGRQTFEGETPLDICYKVCQESPCPPSSVLKEGIPADLDALVLASLAKNPTDRPQTIREFLATLDAVHGVEPWTRLMAKAWWDAHPPPPNPLVSDSDAELGLATRPVYRHASG